MNRTIGFVAGVALALAMLTSDGLARGFAGGGGGGFHGGAGGFSGGAGGAGGYHGGAGNFPAAAAPHGYAAGGYHPNVSPSYNRSPSLSRATPSAGASRTAGAAWSAGSAARPGEAARPTQSQLESFLNLSGPRTAAAGTGVGAAQGSSHTYEGPHGGSVTVAGGTGSRTTPGGAEIQGGGAAVVVEGPHGGTHVAGVGGVEATKGDKTAAAAGSVHGTQTPGGVTTGHARGVAGVTGPGGTVVRAGSTAVVRGPGGNVAGMHRGVVVGPNQAFAVRSGFVNTHWGHWYWTPDWHYRYPGAWFVPAVPVAAWWVAPVWVETWGWVGAPSAAVSYDYGTYITYEGDTVYYGQQPVATAEQYYQQANDLAGSGAADPQNAEWMPLGVFAVVTEGQTKADKILQLAVNKEGVVRGNLHDELTDHVTPLVGAVDKKTQRVAIRAADNPASPVVAECGLWNLTQDTLQILVHFSADRVEPRALIRLTQSEAAAPQNE